MHAVTSPVSTVKKEVPCCPKALAGGRATRDLVSTSVTEFPSPRHEPLRSSAMTQEYAEQNVGEIVSNVQLWIQS